MKKLLKVTSNSDIILKMKWIRIISSATQKTFPFRSILCFDHLRYKRKSLGISLRQFWKEPTYKPIVDPFTYWYHLLFLCIQLHLSGSSYVFDKSCKSILNHCHLTYLLTNVNRVTMQYFDELEDLMTMEEMGNPACEIIIKVKVEELSNL